MTTYPDQMADWMGSIRAISLASEEFNRLQSGPLQAEHSSLTFVILTFNNASTILRCLRSIPVSARVLVVDSGSSDETLKLATRHPGVDVRFREWTDSFSEARNASAAMIDAGWAMFVDADEFFLPGHASRVIDAVRGLETHPERERIRGGVTVLDKDAGVTPFLPRLLRTRSSLSWNGALHERLEASDARQAHLDIALDVTIAHDGYSRDRESRLMRNKRILRKWLKNREDIDRVNLSWSYEHLGPAQQEVRLQKLRSSIEGGKLSVEERLSAELHLLVGILIISGPLEMLRADSRLRQRNERPALPGSLELELLRAQALRTLVTAESAVVRASIARNLLAGCASDPDSDLETRSYRALVDLTTSSAEEKDRLARILQA